MPVVLALVLAVLARPSEALIDVGGWSDATGKDGIICKVFQASWRTRPKGHGFVCARYRPGARETVAAGGSAIAVVFNRKGKVVCTQKSRLKVVNTYCMELESPQCGIPNVQYCQSPGNGARRKTEALHLAATAQAADVTQPPVGKVIRAGKLKCVVISGPDLQRHDPSLVGIDGFFCGPSPFNNGLSGATFANGSELAECEIGVGGTCDMAAKCGLPTVPVCP
jgi:hypothetical protein